MKSSELDAFSGSQKNVFTQKSKFGNFVPGLLQGLETSLQAKIKSTIIGSSNSQFNPRLRLIRSKFKNFPPRLHLKHFRVKRLGLNFLAKLLYRKKTFEHDHF